MQHLAALLTSMCIIIVTSVLINILYSSEYFSAEYTQDLVIARYNENLSWLSRIDLSKFNKVIVYNKGDPFSDSETPTGITAVIALPNVGRCDHTYLYHIVRNYNDLADVTVFLPGSCDMDNKWGQAANTIAMTSATHTSVFYCAITSIPRDVSDFSLDTWKASNDANASKNPENALQLCPERPFGKWYDKNFGNLVVQGVVYFGIFAVAKDHVQNRKKDFYESILRYLDQSSNPEAGHYMERSWIALFDPVPLACKY